MSEGAYVKGDEIIVTGSFLAKLSEADRRLLAQRLLTRSYGLSIDYEAYSDQYRIRRSKGGRRAGKALFLGAVRSMLRL